MPKRLRIALVPLDDRPVCLQYLDDDGRPPAQAEVVAPRSTARALHDAGDTEAIARWLRAQDWRAFDALIVSTDMLAYGGLVASRVHAVDADTALRRLDVLGEIRKAHATLPIYGFSVIMRLAPTADGTNEALARAARAPRRTRARTDTAAETQELATLAQQVPKPRRQDY